MGVDDGWNRVGVDPFAAGATIDTVRRLRGRLAAPVTVWTAYDSEGRGTGITVSSVMVAEGEPASVLGLVGPLSDFWEAAQASGRFIVHVLASEARRVADQFALRYPGDPFEDVSVSRTGWGPSLDAAALRARCSVSGFLEVGYQLLVRGVLDGADLPDEDTSPLIHYRGRYLTTAPRR